MQRYAGKNDPNEYVDNGLHIPIDPVNYRITYPIQNVSEYGISTNRLTGIIESYEMTGVGKQTPLGVFPRIVHLVLTFESSSVGCTAS